MTDELQRAARAMYEAQPKMNRCRWELLPANVKQPWIKAFAAGLESLLPVSDAVDEAVYRARESRHGDGKKSLPFPAEFTAAINHITGADDAAS